MNMAENERNLSLDAAIPPMADPETENVLEEMWNTSMQEIQDIDPGEFSSDSQTSYLELAARQRLVVLEDPPGGTTLS